MNDMATFYTFISHTGPGRTYVGTTNLPPGIPTSMAMHFSMQRSIQQMRKVNGSDSRVLEAETVESSPEKGGMPRWFEKILEQDPISRFAWATRPIVMEDQEPWLDMVDLPPLRILPPIPTGKAPCHG